MAIKLDIDIGDIVLGGKFKNKRVVVKTIGEDELGQPTINGKSLLKFRIEKLMPKSKQSKKTRESLKLEHLMGYLFQENVMTKKINLTPKEIGRADEGWTVVRRRQSDGKIWVAAVNVESGHVHGKGVMVDSVEEVSDAVREVNRWLSKMSQGGHAADRGRIRRQEKAMKHKMPNEGSCSTKEQLTEMIRNQVKNVLEEQGIMQKLGSIGKQAIGINSIRGKNEQENLEKITAFIAPMVESILDLEPSLGKIDPRKPEFPTAVFEAVMQDPRITKLHTNDARIQKALGVVPTTSEDRKAVRSMVEMAVHNIIDTMIEKKENQISRVQSQKAEKDQRLKDWDKKQVDAQMASDSKIAKKKEEAQLLGYQKGSDKWHYHVYGTPIPKQR